MRDVQVGKVKGVEVVVEIGAMSPGLEEPPDVCVGADEQPPTMSHTGPD